MNQLRVQNTKIPGLLIIHLPIHEDGRGWFKENWQRAKMVELGLPDFGPVQQNVAHNAERGVTRGIHAEPWDKFISLTSGRIFAAWVDLREGPSFGQVVTSEVSPDIAVFVPRGVGNAYQTLEDDTDYTYLVNDHWSPTARDKYIMVNLYDPTLAIRWPINNEQAELSEADRHHPLLSEVEPIPAKRVTVVGVNGQLGRALARVFPDAQLLDKAALDITNAKAVSDFDWSTTSVIINAAAYTKVDEAETPHGRRMAWAVNAHGVANLAAAARQYQLGLVHISSDYVFDGTQKIHTEDELFSPLGVYGQTKAAGDLAAATVSRHWIIRTSWLIGDGPNFVATMTRLAHSGASPEVVNDQYGRLTFTTDLAKCIRHLLETNAPTGTYNLTCDGYTTNWFAVAQDVFQTNGRNPKDVAPVTAQDWASGRQIAPRPMHSTLALEKLKATGFSPPVMEQALAEHPAILTQSTHMEK